MEEYPQRAFAWDEKACLGSLDQRLLGLISELGEVELLVLAMLEPSYQYRMELAVALPFYYMLNYEQLELIDFGLQQQRQHREAQQYLHLLDLPQLGLGPRLKGPLQFFDTESIHPDLCKVCGAKYSPAALKLKWDHSITWQGGPKLLYFQKVENM